ncbi:hypothetical protein IP90_02604 [Luteimonas cucumeris]|uniref:Uncharacterized protein n=1 Tax=Luteimonas cucumeris TaxID=985012 RepID=A0A562L017_9GAMM|nr:hypothetical protein [Luteimonas cucumeris]TWI00982.1 hypothetical protein IP90_02604 [Luteimonas cucumeris]
MASTGMQVRSGVWGTGAWPWVLLLLSVAVLGFWVPYFSRLTNAQGLAHLHVLAMLAWLGMLIAQPMLIRGRQLVWHRRIGKVSYAVVPLLVISALALAQLRIREASPQALPIQQFILYLGLSASMMFVLIWGLGIRYRRNAALHARFMVGTMLTLIDPSLVRVMIFWVPGVPPPMYQWITFGLIYAILALLIALDRRAPRGRPVFPTLLGLFVVLHASILLVPGTAAWQRFASWYAAL